MSASRTALALALLGSSVAQADMCDRPPFGASQPEWEAAQPELQAISANLQEGTGLLWNWHSRNWYLEHVVYRGLWKACRARFSASDLEDKDFAQAGIDLLQQKALPPITLAIRFFHSQGLGNIETDMRCNGSDADGRAIWSTAEGCMHINPLGLRHRR